MLVSGWTGGYPVVKTFLWIAYFKDTKIQFADYKVIYADWNFPLNHWGMQQENGAVWKCWGIGDWIESVPELLTDDLGRQRDVAALVQLQ